MTTSPSRLRRVSSRVLPPPPSTSLDDDEIEDMVGAEAVLLDSTDPAAVDPAVVGRTSSSTSAVPSSLRGAYALRKFLSTPHHHRRGNNNTNDIDDDGNGIGDVPPSRRLRRAPSYDPAIDDASRRIGGGGGALLLPSSSSSSSSLFRGLLMTDDDVDVVRGEGESDGRGGGGGGGVEASLLSSSSSLFDYDGPPSRARSSSMSSSAVAGGGGLSSPVALKRMSISLRRKKSTPRRGGKGGGGGVNDFVDDDDDDMSTVAESMENSSRVDYDMEEYDRDEKRERAPGKWRRRRRRAMAAVFSLLTFCAVGVVAYLALSGRGGDGVDGRTHASHMLASSPEEGSAGVVGDEDVDVVPCSTEARCEERYASMKDAGVIVGHFYASYDFPIKGCTLKGENVYFGLGGTVDEITASPSGESVSVMCLETTTTTAGGGGQQEQVQAGSDPLQEVASADVEEEEDVVPTSWPTTSASLSANDPEAVGAPVGEDAGDEVSPTSSPSSSSSAPTTAAPVVAEGTVTTFYIMADCPYTDEEREDLMPRYIEDLGDDAEFLVHLGDLEYAKEDKCEEWAYESASSILLKSRVPTFVVPGDNDMNDCPDVEDAEMMWTKYFKRMDETWEHDFVVTRWGRLDESFSFLRKGVLYFGLNVPGGTPNSSSDTEELHDEHLERIASILDGLSDDEYRVIVLLGHADPSYGDAGYSQGLFEKFANIVRESGKPTVHFHGDYHEYYEVEGGGHEVDNYMRISLDGDSIAPPIRVEIDVSKENPIKVSRRKSGLVVDCCSDGWPSREEL